MKKRTTVVRKENELMDMRKKIAQAVIPLANELNTSITVLTDRCYVVVNPGSGRSNDWNLGQVALALKDYLKPQGKKYEAKLARAMGRSKGAISFKKSNLRKFDRSARSRGAKGAGNGSRADKAVWTLYRRHPKEFASLVARTEREYGLA